MDLTLSKFVYLSQLVDLSLFVKSGLVDKYVVLLGKCVALVGKCT